MNVAAGDTAVAAVPADPSLAALVGQRVPSPDWLVSVAVGDVTLHKDIRY